MNGTDLPPLDACGFVRVPSPVHPPLWMTCNACGKSDHFFVRDERIHCRCGASYDHAVRPDESQVPFGELELVPFEKGPRHLADLEWDPRRIALLVAVALSLLLATIFGLYWLL